MSDAPLTGIELRIWRLSHGLSQPQLAEIWGFQWRAVSDWETGKKNIRSWVRLAMRGYDAEHGGSDNGD